MARAKSNGTVAVMDHEDSECEGRLTFATLTTAMKKALKVGGNPVKCESCGKFHLDDVDDAVAPQRTGNQTIKITPIRMHRFQVLIVGTSPLLQARFSKKAFDMMKEKQAAGSTADKKKTRTARDFNRDFIESQHVAEEGWNGLPAAAFRNACIEAGRMTAYKMTHLKPTVFIVADGLDAKDATPLVKIIDPETREPIRPEYHEAPVRNSTGVADIRVRSIWKKWAVLLTVQFDADMITLEEACNLLNRAGVQIGVGEGRNFSKQSNGTGHGSFKIKSFEGVDENPEQ